jgi:phosphatidylglycerol:prolipoprotein diacylglycerol transferase
VILPVIVFPAIDPVALHLGPISIRWYGLAYVAAFIVAGIVMHWLVGRWKLNISDDDQLTIIIAAVIGVIVGGRLGYVLVYGGSFFLSNPARIFAIWDGGMSFHGGLAGILIAGLIVSRMMGIPWLTLCDIGSVGAPVGIFFGRIANFINGELWGRPTNVPWAMVFPNADALPRHPSQLYEALLEGLVLFLVMLWFATRKPNPPRGVILGWLLTLYGVFRIFVEFFRQPDIQMGAKGFLAFGVTTGQLLSVPMVVAGIWLIVWAGRRGLPELGRAENAPESARS